MATLAFNIAANASFKVSALSPNWRGFLTWQVVGNLAGFITVLTLTGLLRTTSLHTACTVTTGLAVLGVQIGAAFSSSARRSRPPTGSVQPSSSWASFSSASTRSMRRLIRCFDAQVRRAVGVIEFTQDPECILRLRRTTLHRSLILPDASLPKGTPALEFHLWNERVPPLPPSGADLAWALHVSRSLIRSFRMAGAYLATELAEASPQAVGGTTVLGPASGTSADVLARLGFHPQPCSNPLGQFGEGWENAYTWSLMWACNPVSLRGKHPLRLRRTEYWMSVSAFVERFPAS